MARVPLQSRQVPGTGGEVCLHTRIEQVPRKLKIAFNMILSINIFVCITFNIDLLLLYPKY